MVTNAATVSLIDGNNQVKETQILIPEFKEDRIWIWQEDDGLLTKEELLDYVEYEGNKNELDLTIESHLVYVIKGEYSYYYHDLNRVLKKANFDDLYSFDEEYAKRLGFTAAEGSSPFIDTINLTHGGGTYYSLTVSNEHGSSYSFLQVHNKWVPEPEPPIEPEPPLIEPEPEPPVIDPDPEPEPPVESEPPMVIDPEPEPEPPIVVEPEKLPNLKFNNQRNNFSVKPYSTISMKELQDLVEFENNKQDLEFAIFSNMVYVPKGSKKYHYDLDDLLKTSKVDDIKVYTEKDAISKGLSPSDENGSAVSLINRSLPGKYTVEASYDFGEEGRRISVTGEILVTDQAENDSDPDDSTETDDVTNDDNKSAGGSNNGSNNRNTNRQTISSSKQSKLPATGSQRLATISIIGFGIFATGVYILSKKKQLNKKVD
ncbi:LPXTG cell wall anchor domain-containing protein [Enterococcus sp. AZ051]|uniref:LPXTG cell wall anchor domain-containing protein n=1 Tax=Enterococcus sp. AZ051 TaxID=2774698 RepID=UPI003D289B88